MPFGKYKDFADCVVKNSSSNNPEAVCAKIHKKITGKWPTEFSHMSKNIQLAKMLKGVKIVEPGDFTAAVGGNVSFDQALFEKLVSNFEFGVPIPLKLGHTSEEFNSAVAAALEIPVETVKGEGSRGKGAAKLGEVIRLEVDDGLRADVKFANDKVADLFIQGFFDTFSIEMAENFVWGPGKHLGKTLTGLAALGAQIPAVVDLPKVEQQQLLSNGTQADTIWLCEVSKESKIIEGWIMAEKEDDENKDETEEEKKKRIEAQKDEEDEDEDEDEEKTNMELATVLGKALSIPASEVTPELVITKVGELVNSQEKNISHLEATDGKILELSTQLKLMEYKEKTAPLTAIAGTPEELAQKLVDVELKAGKDTATILLESLQKQNELQEAHTKQQTVIDKNDPDKIEEKTYEFETKVEEYAKANGITYQEAYGRYAMENVSDFNAYRTEKNNDLSAVV